MRNLFPDCRWHGHLHVDSGGVHLGNVGIAKVEKLLDEPGKAASNGFAGAIQLREMMGDGAKFLPGQQA